MKEEENIIKQEENQFYIPHFIVPMNYVPIPNEVEHYKSTIRNLMEENHLLRKLLKQSQESQIISLTREQLQDEVFNMIDFLMKNLNYLPKEQIFAYQKTIRQCIQKRTLKYIFFQIFTRYLQAIKTKEEMTKFIIRKSVKNQKQIQNKEFCIQKKEMKKMNNAFVQHLFSSPTYKQHYQIFLNQYLQLALNENQQKIRKYVLYLVELIYKEQIDQVLNYKRFPWLNEWINQSVQIAQDLLSSNSKSQQENLKKIKI